MAGLENIRMGVSYLHPIFFSEFFGECNLLDFAEAAEGGVGGVVRNAARSSAWPALHISLTFSRLLDATPLCTSQPTAQIFGRVQFA